ncbi:pectinesterase inhibitor 10-like [Abrus precatorius]|uniref:Pectinesterase inhibitor 10-like n=1 Tax=Abrus precatorius TaxID=3816 RepID=A0A8B8LTH8_ABRPR|nr:pectinesterase inhibitor 10-like [Abrus precatorius]
MASRKTYNQFVLMICFVLLGQCGRIHNTEGGEDLVTATCKHTLHFQVCISSLKSVPGSKKSNPKILAYIALNLSTTYAAETLSYIHELKSSFTANGPNNNIYVSRCLSDCAEEYSEAIENLRDSAQALPNREFDKVDTLVCAAMSDAET